jgi:hypothetical protein
VIVTGSLTASSADFAARTGWVAKPEGLCKGPMCVPLPTPHDGSSPLDLSVVAERLGMPVVHDEANGEWALGPATVGGHALESAELPELVLPDLDGREFDFRSLRGKKVVAFAWASW